MAIDLPCVPSSPPGPGQAVDGRVLDGVRAVIGDDGVRRCLSTYLRLLPERLEGARLAAEAGQRSAAARLLADLRAGSGMFGARDLAALAAAAEDALRADGIGAGGASGAGEVEWAPISRQAEHVERELSRYLDRLGALGGGYGPGFGPPNR